MSAARHPDEIDIDAILVSRLIANQFPRWTRLPVVRVRSSGTDHAIYRLGEDMAVRLPRLARAAETVAREQRWLARLAPLLPLPVPVPLGHGAPDGEFPYPWSVYRRAEAGADDATWTRGRGWGLGLGLGAVHVYRATNPVLAAIGLRAINEAIADYLLSG